MTRILRSDPTSVKKFILYCALFKIPVFKAFTKLCDTLKNLTFDYVDFEWKYWQFYNGNRDLGIEKSSENSSSLTFSDLPIDALEKVLDKLKMTDRLLLRKVSSDLRNLIGDSHAYCNEIKMYSDYDTREILIDREIIAYKDGYIEQGELDSKPSKYYTVRRFKKVETDQDLLTMMARDVATLLNNPKLRIGHFYLDKTYTELCPLETLLQSWSSQIHAERVSILGTRPTNVIISILQKMSSETLKKLCLDLSPYSYGYENEMNEMKKLVETEQWKKAEVLHLKGVPAKFPIYEMAHFKQIQISAVWDIDAEMLAEVGNILLKLPHFERFLVVVEIEEPCREEFRSERAFDNEVKRLFFTMDEIDTIMSQHPEYDSKTHRFRIPNSSEYFQFKIADAESQMVYGFLTLSLCIKRSSLPPDSDDYDVDEFDF